MKKFWLIAALAAAGCSDAPVEDKQAESASPGATASTDAKSTEKSTEDSGEKVTQYVFKVPGMA